MKSIFFGDLCITNSNVNFFVEGNKRKLFSDEFMNAIKVFDFLSINLESPLIKSNARPIIKCGPTLGADYNSIKGIALLNPSLVCIANNHIYDYGYNGLITTIESLKEKGINYIGDRNGEAKNDVFIKDDVGVINFCENEFSFNYKDNAGACCLDSSVYSKIVELKKQVKRVIVVFHGGTENFEYPSPKMVQLCHSFADLGANLILCQHSHCIGCYEKYHECTIVYGQGNFLFDEYSKEDIWTHAIGVEYNSANNEVNYIVTCFKNGKVDIVNEEEKALVLNKFEQRSKELLNGEYIKKYKNYCNYRYSKFLCKLRGYSKIRTGIEVLLFKGFFVKNLFRGKRLYALYDILNCEAHQELIMTSMIDSVFEETKQN